MLQSAKVYPVPEATPVTEVTEPPDTTTVNVALEPSPRRVSAVYVLFV